MPHHAVGSPRRRERARGARAADAAARRWLAEGRRVRVATPDLPGQDFNDLLLARMAKGDSHG